MEAATRDRYTRDQSPGRGALVPRHVHSKNAAGAKPLFPSRNGSSHSTGMFEEPRITSAFSSPGRAVSTFVTFTFPPRRIY